MAITKDAKERKALPITTGVLDYFPDALLEVARCSKVGNDQHNPGQPLHWAKEKSTDEPDALVRHLLERGTLDSDGIRHSAKVAWRALAMLQREIDAERAALPQGDDEPDDEDDRDERPAEGAEYICNAGQSGGDHLVCTRPKGHEGGHVGHGSGGEVLARWPR